MLPESAIVRAVNEHLRIAGGRFVFKGKASSGSAAEENETPQAEFILGFIGAVDLSWPFDVEPAPRAVGSCVEVLRGCRFFPQSGSDSEILIVQDKGLSKRIGAFDTPDAIVDYLTEAAIKPFVAESDLPLVVDPACGAGYFLIKALDVLVREHKSLDPLHIVEKFIRGIDIDPVAIELSKRNLRWHLMRNYNCHASNEQLRNVLLHADALSNISAFPVQAGEVHAVIANPPYQFLSGRDSPAALLRRDGRHDEAERLEKEIAVLSVRFPESSKGCRDRYKWFIDRAVEILRPGGRLGFVTPNTWLAYPKYRDIRTILADKGHIEEVIDLGAYAFNRVNVPAATVVWTKGDGGPNREFKLVKISKDQWKGLAVNGEGRIEDFRGKGNIARIDSHGDITCIDNSRMASNVRLLREAPMAPHRVRLGDVVTLKEGSHAIRAVPLDTSRMPSEGSDFPVIIDKTLAPMTPPEIGYIPPPGTTVQMEHHSGERFFLRKTNDRLIVAPSPTLDFALAHQNVYVGRIKGDAIPFLALVGILSSSLLTAIYRAGPGGQHGRRHAQLRILFLNQLPIVIVPEEWRSNAGFSTEESRAIAEAMKSGEPPAIVPVPVDFPSDEEAAIETARRIRTYHDVIARLTKELIETRADDITRAIDKVVYYLYGGHELDG